jgi:RHS repeat-associated protein
MIYENGILKRILVDGGYIEGGVYYFYLADNEGNNWVVANASGTVVQANHYYPFGMPFTEGNATSSQPYKYNGKELDTERGLNLYDYGARLYDPALARWTTQDLMAEKYYSAEFFNSTVLNFKKGSESNATGIYNNYPLRRKNQIVLY